MLIVIYLKFQYEAVYVSLYVGSAYVAGFLGSFDFLPFENPVVGGYPF